MRKFQIDILEKTGYLCEVEAESQEEAIKILKEQGCEDYAIDINKEIDWEDVHTAEIK